MSILNRVFEARRNAQEELRGLYESAGDDPLNAEGVAVEERLAAKIVDLQKREQNMVEMLDADSAADEARAASFEAPKVEKSVVGPSDNDIFRSLAGQGVGARHEFRDNVTLTAGTATDGAEVVPTTLRTQLVEFMRASATVMQEKAMVINTSGGEDLVVPTVSSYSAASIVAENGQIGNDAPQFSSVTLGAYKYAFLIPVSSELLADQGFDITPFLARQAGVALARGAGAHFINGSGSGQPLGVDSATTGVTAASATAITGDELINLSHSIVDPYRGNATWIMKDSTAALIRKLKDGNSQYLWQPGLAAGAPDTLLGRPVRIDDAVDAATTGLDAVIFGDIASAYAIRFAGGVNVAVSNDFNFDYDVTTYRFTMRADGDIVDANAVRVLTML